MISNPTYSAYAILISMSGRERLSGRLIANKLGTVISFSSSRLFYHRSRLQGGLRALAARLPAPPGSLTPHRSTDAAAESDAVCGSGPGQRTRRRPGPLGFTPNAARPPRAFFQC